MADEKVLVVAKHRELLDEVALGYYGISIIDLDDEYWDGVSGLLRKARAEWRTLRAKELDAPEQAS